MTSLPWLSRSFRPWRTKVQSASAVDGEEALAKMDATGDPFDVVITDNNMPRLSGLELVRELRGRNFPGEILVLSVHLSEENTQAYQALSLDT